MPIWATWMYCSVHVDKMKEWSKELTTGCSMCLEKLVLCAQVWSLPPYKMIRSVADEMLAKGTINWGRIVALYTFVHLFVKSLCKCGQHLYNYILHTKMTVATELHQYMDLHL